MGGQWRFVFDRPMMFFVTNMGERPGFEVVSGGEFTAGRLGVHGKARHFFNLIINFFTFLLIFFSVAINSSSLFFIWLQ